MKRIHSDGLRSKDGVRHCNKYHKNSPLIQSLPVGMGLLWSLLHEFFCPPTSYPINAAPPRTTRLPLSHATLVRVLLPESGHVSSTDLALSPCGSALGPQ